MKTFLKKFKDMFCTPQAPVGLTAMGLQANYLGKIYKSDFSMSRFYTDLMSPVNEPFFFNE